LPQPPPTTQNNHMDSPEANAGSGADRAAYEAGLATLDPAIDVNRLDLYVLKSAIANHQVFDPTRQRAVIEGLQFVATTHPRVGKRILAARALGYIDSVNQRREAKLLDILCDRSRDPLPNPAPAVASSQTVIGQVNVIAAGDQPASDPMSGLLRLIQSGLPVLAGQCPSEVLPSPSAPITALHDKPGGGQRGLVPSADDGSVPGGQLDTPPPAERPEMPSAGSLLDRIRKNGANGNGKSET
jgi:hypothetical protein